MWTMALSPFAPQRGIGPETCQLGGNHAADAGDVRANQALYRGDRALDLAYVKHAFTGRDSIAELISPRRPGR